jgi:hypothetical protein
MTLYINTIKNNSTEIEAALLDTAGKVIVRKIIKARYQQAEKLLPLIDSVLNSYKRKMTETGKKKKNYELPARNATHSVAGGRIKNYGFIAMIEVVNRGGTFTSLRIGVATANALGYALNIPVIGIGELKPASKKWEHEVSKSKSPESESLKVRSQRFNLVAPEYDKEPNITLKSHNS